MSNILDFCGKEPSKPLGDAGSSSTRQSSHSRSTAKENSDVGPSSRKRSCAVIDTNDVVSKRLCTRCLRDESRQDLPDQLCNPCQTNQYGNYFPHRLIGLMYQLDLSILCLCRKFTYEHKYPSLSLTFGDSEVDKFNNIVLRYKEKSIHIQIENVDKYYINNGISYARLFTKEKLRFSINNYFDSFVKHLIYKSGTLSNNIEYLIVYSNFGLDLTKEEKLNQGRFRNFHPFKFHSINIEDDILKDFLFTNDNTKGCGFYQFSRDNTTRKELFKRLEFSSAVQTVIKERTLPQEEIKEMFLDKLVFAVSQPNREELNSIIKNEIGKNITAHYNYIALQKEVLCDLTAPEKYKRLEKLVHYIPGIIYEFNLLILFLHDMFLHENISSINSARKSHDTRNDITIHYKGKSIYIVAHTTDGNIDYSQLFSSRQQNNTFSVNKLFTLFTDEFKGDIKYFIVYTNVDLGLTEEKRIAKGRSKDAYPLKFDNIDTRKKKYKILRDCLCIGENALYQFVQEETTREKLLKLLKLPPSLQKEKEDGRLSNNNEKEKKEKFLSKLMFAVHQSNQEKLSSIKNEINKCDKVPYNYEELHEIALRWSESHEFGHITKGVMKKLLEDIQNNRFSYPKDHNKNINQEIKFAKSVIGREGTPAFDQFLDFLIKEERLEILKRKGIKLATVSGILCGAGTNASKALKGLQALWFDEDGNKTRYLKTLEKNGINLATMSSILIKAGVNAPEAFGDLYDLWFDEEGNKKQYLKILEEEGINLATMSSILNGAGAKAPKVFKDLYDLWFDKEGNKKEYLKVLEEKGINLANMSSILSGAGANAPKSFKDLYNFWFDEQGNKKQYLQNLDLEGINLANMSSILSGAGANAAKAFKNLYDLWFDEEGNKKQYLKSLEEKGINLTNISSILHRAGSSAPKAFTELYNTFFDEQGDKKQYLKTLEEEGINLANISSILSGAGTNAARAFKDLYNLWFDEEGNKKEYLKTLEEKGINLTNISSIVCKAGSSAPKAFTELYNTFFDEQGDKKQYLKTLEEKGINLANMSSVLSGAGANAAKAFRDLYNLWFDEEGNKKHYLRTLEEKGINLSNISSILHGAGANAPKAFEELYNAFFDEEGNIKRHLKHFIRRKNEEKSFTLHNLSGILSGAGANAKDAFEKLHSACFNDKGKRTELLNDFYKADFRPSNLSSMLCGTGVRAFSTLKQLHSVCFNKKRAKTKLLDDFCNVGFRTCDLCSILSGTADSLKKFHDFCFMGDTKKYFHHFLNEKEGFTLTNLSDILHGAKTNICSALKDFHDICFDDTGNKAQLLIDFYTAGFKPSDLSDILSMAGNNATSMLRNFHKSCFNKKKYLNHFLVEKNLFTPKNLSKILDRVGINICSVFEKLHGVCFDETGNKTHYFKNLIKNNPPNAIFNTLYETVRKAPPTFLYDTITSTVY